jgi:KDO2-lipid IV(A) lauroyltransferase
MARTGLSNQPSDEKPRPDFKLEPRRAVRYRISVALTATVSWIAWLMPANLRKRIATVGGDIYLRYFPTYRANVMDNLRHALPGASEYEIDLATRSVFQQAALNFIDLFLIPHEGRKPLATKEDPLVGGSWSYLDDALKLGNGAIILTAHLGPFDHIMQFLNQRGYRITSVTGRTTSRFVFDGITWLRRQNHAAIVEASPSGIKQVFQALKRGECAAFLGDYDFSGSGFQVKMFGSTTRVPQGPVRIARDTGAPIVPLFSRRVGDRHHLILLPPFQVKKTRDKEADLKEGLRRVAESIEYAVSRTPDQWVMFQRLFLPERDAPGRVRPIGSVITSAEETAAP